MTRGGLSRSSLPQLPFVREHLGPVLATGYNITVKSTNQLGFGFPARGWSDLQEACCLIVHADANDIPTLIAEGNGSDFPFAELPLIVWDTELSSTCIQSFFPGDQELATCHLFDPEVSTRILVEGTAEARRWLRQVFGTHQSDLIEVDPGCKPAILQSLDVLRNEINLNCLHAANDLERSGIKAPLALDMVRNTMQVQVRRLAMRRTLTSDSLG